MEPNISRRGMMLVLSSPSGAGKTSIARRVLSEEPGIGMSVSMTTRARRAGETDGTDYHFVDLTTFNLMVNRREFLEYAKVFDHYYGTPRSSVERDLAAGRDILFDIDWQGTQTLAQAARDDLVSIFILPPTTAELERRLRSRASDSPEVVARRMARAADEMSHWPEYDYVVVNRDLEESVQRVRAILWAERLRRRRQPGLAEFVKSLREGY